MNWHSNHRCHTAVREAGHLALREWLTVLGLLKHRDDPEGAN